MLLLALNWKMAPEKAKDAATLAKQSFGLAKQYKKALTITVCPPFVHIPVAAKVSRALLVGGQTVAGDAEAAQTGLVSAGMLKAAGAAYCIVGHSELRARGETNVAVAAQVQRLLEKKIVPIVCVGERARDTQGWYLSEVKDQLESFLHGISKTALKHIVIAYEPVWAIGSKATREATPAECREMLIYIRKIIADAFDAKAGDGVRILYGGSVNEKNASLFISEGKAQGLLVGRVSLDAKRLKALAASLAQ